MFRITDPLTKRRLQCSLYLDKLFNSTIMYGPFKGLRLLNHSWWGTADRASMLLGLYEQELLTSLSDIPQKYKTFIDLGAADGYYAVGVLRSNMFEKSYAFEISKSGQEVIKKNAENNNISEKIFIRGEADKKFYEEVPCCDIENSVLFIDIEGGEFDLLDKNIFSIFHNSIIFIELHDWFFVDGDQKLSKLRDDAKDFFRISELTQGSRDPSKFPELRELSDNDRWLICSEGRGQLMRWIRLDPLHDY